MAEAWAKRLCNLIKRYQSSSDVASFRNDYRDVVSKASDQNNLSASTVSLLLQAREYLESWTSVTPPEPPVAFDQWQNLYEAGKNRLPDCVLEAFLRRFPSAKPGMVKWESFLLSCSDAHLIDALLDRRLVREQDLNRLAQAKPAEFYRSVALDVIVERTALRNYRPIWEECVRGTPRASGLLSREKVLVHCYSVSPGDEENERMLSFLLASPQDQAKVLGLLLGEQRPALRFCRYLVFGAPKVGRHAQEETATKIQDVLISWIAQCAAELEKGIGLKAETASLVLGLIRLSLLTETEDAETAKRGKLSEDTARVTQTTVLHVLQKMEESRSSSGAETAFVGLGKELYQVVQEYLRCLPVGTSTGQESPERALRFERYLGSKQVIELVLLAMGEPLDESGLRDALEVAMFNCGVRPLGNVGEQLLFDAHMHEAETPGVLPGDPVIITHSGRCLGDREEVIVLIKAKIRPVPHADTA